MPKFAYQCQDCQNEFEYLSVRTDDHPSCPKCSGTKLKKQVSTFSVGNSSPKFKTMEKIRRFNREAEASKKAQKKEIIGCARGYANRVLRDYKG